MVPALAVADALSEAGVGVSFAGTPERAEATLVPERGYEIDFLALRGLDRRNPVKAAAAAARAVGGTFAARRLLRARGADAVMGGGGYVAGPVGLAATAARLPLVLTEADSHLGLTNRMLASRARRVCLAFPIAGREGEPYLLTGRPVPPSVLAADRDAARARYGIAPEDRCLLLFGGSLGARTINLAAAAAFGDGGGERGPAGGNRGSAGGDQTPRGFHVLHISGERDHAEVAAAVGAAERYTLLAYEPDLGDALAAADLVLARAGGSIFEVTAAGKPAILVPYPHASASHQHTNAGWMVEAGAAVMVEDAELDAARLVAEVERLFADPDRLARMAEASRSISRPDAAERIAAEILACL